MSLLMIPMPETDKLMTVIRRIHEQLLRTRKHTHEDRDCLTCRRNAERLSAPRGVVSVVKCAILGGTLFTALQSLKHIKCSNVVGISIFKLMCCTTFTSVRAENSGTLTTLLHFARIAHPKALKKCSTPWHTYLHFVTTSSSHL